MATQWHGVNVLIGLRYEVLGDLRRVAGISDEDWPRTFRDLRVMELAVLGMRSA